MRFFLFWRRDSDHVSAKWLASQRRAEIDQSASVEGPCWRWDDIKSYCGWTKKWPRRLERSRKSA